MYGYIYLTENLLNGKYYVGQHKSDIFDPSYLGSGLRIKRAISKYGRNSFTVKMVQESTSAEELNRLEIEHIARFKDKGYVLYNITTGGGSMAHVRKIPFKKTIEFDGKSLPIHEWSKLTGITKEAIRQRIIAGWPVDKMLTLPNGKRRVPCKQPRMRYKIPLWRQKQRPEFHNPSIPMPI